MLVARGDGHPQLIEDVRLLVSELATNSLVHGGVRDEGEFTLAIETNGVIRVEVIDHGPGFDPSSRRGQPDVGGFGLRLVDRIAVRWGVVRAREGTRVWFELEPDAYPSC